jgi:membrane protein YdbS with pleckstrin-like domain
MIQFYQDEKIMLEQRKHWYVIATQGAIIALVALASLIIVSALFQSSIGPALKTYWPHILLLMGAWFLVLWTTFFIIWTNFYLNVLIVTNQRIIDVEQISLFNRDIVNIPLSKVQDVKVRVSGFLPTMLNFGDIYIQSAAATPEVAIYNLAEPHKAQKVILKLHNYNLK